MFITNNIKLIQVADTIITLTDLTIVDSTRTQQSIANGNT